VRRPERIEPGPGQESVWDYPRPPRLERTTKRIEVIFAGVKVADSQNAWRVLETSHPPVYYLPRGDVLMEHLESAEGSSFCEWKGAASYFDIVVAERVATQAAWTYRSPTARFAEIRDHLAFFAPRLDAAFVDGERVTPQPGGFYGGWITADVVGPFKGGPGSWGW
jgi:uncharacterized protein (DUF427 family)